MNGKQQRAAAQKEEERIDGSITVRGFADKYGIDYMTVYNSTWNCKPLTRSMKYKLYDEKDLLEAVLRLAKHRAERLREDLRRAEETIRKCAVGKAKAETAEDEPGEKK